MVKLTAVRNYEPGGGENVLIVHLGRDGREVDMRTVDDDGSLGTRLLTLSPNGIRRRRGLSPDLGLPLDPDGRIMLDESA